MIAGLAAFGIWVGVTVGHLQEAADGKRAEISRLVDDRANLEQALREANERLLREGEPVEPVPPRTSKESQAPTLKAPSDASIFEQVTAYCALRGECRGLPGVTGLVGSSGEPGADGAAGETGRPGPAGADGVAGNDGAPGSDGAPGKDGEDGAPGKDGSDGTPGKDGVSASAGAGCAAPDGEYVAAVSVSVSGAGVVGLSCEYRAIPIGGNIP